MSFARRGTALVIARHYTRSQPALGIGDTARKVGEKVKDYFTKVSCVVVVLFVLCCAVLCCVVVVVVVVVVVAHTSQGNLVNPRATNPMQPDDYRKHSPASTEPVNLPLPDNPETIYYHPRASRQFVEDQVVLLKVWWVYFCLFVWTVCRGVCVFVFVKKR